MDQGRIWQRGASKGRKGSTNARMMQSNGEKQNNNQPDSARRKGSIKLVANRYSNSDNVV